MKRHYSYIGDLGPDKKSAVTNQLLVEERERPLVFAGRDAILQRLSAQIQRVTEDTNHQIDSIIQVIQGPPGSGKTSVIRRLVELFDTSNSPAKFVHITGKDLITERDFLRAVISDLDADTNRLTIKSTVKTGGSLNLQVIKGQVSEEHEQASILDRLEIQAVWRIVEDLLGGDRILVLCIDEAQTIRSNQDQQYPILIDLHSGRTGNLRILPIFAGLNDTIDILGHCGASRISTGSQFPLGALSFQEAKSVVLGTLNHESIGIRGMFTTEDQNSIAASLGIASDQWPRHLYHYIQGLLLEILSDQERLNPLHRIDLNKVLEYGHEARVQYYTNRVRLLKSDTFTTLLMDTVNHSTGGFSKSQLKQTARLEYNISDSDFEAAFSEATHFGIIEQKGLGQNKLFDIPIPSLRTFLMCYGDEQKTIELLQELHRQDLSKELKLRQSVLEAI